MKKKSHTLSVLFVLLASLLLSAAVFGCLGTQEYVIEGKIMTEDGSQPFADAPIYIELVNRTDAQSQVIMQRLLLENGSKVNYTYHLVHHNVLDPKGIYIVSAYADMDRSGNISDGDYVSKTVMRLEPNMIEQPFDVYVYLQTAENYSSSGIGN